VEESLRAELNIDAEDGDLAGLKNIEYRMSRI
jgi:hypothetical protein